MENHIYRVESTFKKVDIGYMDERGNFYRKSEKLLGSPTCIGYIETNFRSTVDYRTYNRVIVEKLGAGFNSISEKGEVAEDGTIINENGETVGYVKGNSISTKDGTFKTNLIGECDTSDYRIGAALLLGMFNGDWEVSLPNDNSATDSRSENDSRHNTTSTTGGSGSYGRTGGRTGGGNDSVFGDVLSIIWGGIKFFVSFILIAFCGAFPIYVGPDGFWDEHAWIITICLPAIAVVMILGVFFIGKSEKKADRLKGTVASIISIIAYTVLLTFMLPYKNPGKPMSDVDISLFLPYYLGFWGVRLIQIAILYYVINKGNQKNITAMRWYNWISVILIMIQLSYVGVNILLSSISCWLTNYPLKALIKEIKDKSVW